ncbi:MAG: ABC transporter permease [Gammaproteobacteria bacterium]
MRSLHAIAAIAGQVLVEGARSRLPWVLGGLTALVVALARLAGAVALTESAQSQAAIGGALLRLTAVLVTSGFVVTSVAREQADQADRLVFALALPRAAWLLGKLAGFALAAAVPALLFTLLAMRVSDAPSALVWGATLWCELWIVAAFALLCAVGMGSALAALAATAAFYLLARAIGDLARLAHEQGGSKLTDTVIDALAALLPHLDGFARADWLAYGDAGLAQLAPALAQTALAVTLLTAAALFDLYRKPL